MPETGVFVPRTVPPQADEKWWKVGQNPCIARYNGTVLPNCVGYAHGRFCEILGYFHPDLPRCNAGMWIERLGKSLSWGKTPKLGAVAVWKRPGAAGHVAVVEYLNSDGSVMMSESGYSKTWNTRFWNSKRSGPNWYNSSYHFQGFIYNPATEGITKVAPWDGGTPSGTNLAGDNRRYSGIYTGVGQNLTSYTGEDDMAGMTYQVAPPHPAKKFIAAALQHAGTSNDGRSWVKEKTGCTNQGWSTAMVCAAALESDLGAVIPTDKFSCSDFGTTLVESLGGTYHDGALRAGKDNPQLGDIVATYTGSIISTSKYSATKLGIVTDVNGDVLSVAEGDVKDFILLFKRRVNDILWFVRPNWTAAGGSEEINSLFSNPIYSTMNTRSDAMMREVTYLTNEVEPSITSSTITLSAINYTGLLSKIYDAAGFSSTLVGGSSSYVEGGEYSADSSGLPGNAKVIFDFLVSRGMTPAQSIGVLANIKQESGYSPSAVNPSSGASGICQWLGARKTNMVKHCGSNWKSNLTGQCEFLWIELQGVESRSLSAMQAVTGNDVSAAEEAAKVWCKSFERPGNYTKEFAIRAKNARELWSMITVTSTGTRTYVSAGTSGPVRNSSGQQLTNGNAVSVPSSVRQTGIIANYTSYTSFYSRWTRGTNQRRIADIWGQKGKTSNYYVATIDGLFLIALAPVFGKCGDIVSVRLNDGSYFNAIIADQKGADKQNTYGHVLGGKVDIVEWEANGSNQSSLKSGLQQAGWLGKTVTQIINYGSYL